MVAVWSSPLPSHRRDFPAVFFCKSSPIWLQELPADLDIFVNIAAAFFFLTLGMLYNYNVYLFVPSLLPLEIMQAV